MLKEGLNKYFWDVIKNHYIDFSGRATPKQFWLFVVINAILGNILFLICEIFFPIQIQIGVSIIYWVILLLPSLAITARRFTDAGVSFIWFVILIVLSFVGSLMLAISAISIISGMLIFVVPIATGERLAQASILFIPGLLLFLLSYISAIIICVLPSKPTLMK